jgi:hypothetical protein
MSLDINESDADTSLDRPALLSSKEAGEGNQKLTPQLELEKHPAPSRSFFVVDIMAEES